MEADTGTAAGFVYEESGNLIGWPFTFSPRWRKNLVDQSIICSFEWVDEPDALQDEPILQIFSEQAPHAGTLRRSPQHRVPEWQSVSSDGFKRRRKIAVVGRLYWEYSTPGIDPGEGCDATAGPH